MDNKIWPKISIITVCRNTPQYLENCIQSVFAQNYPNLEYIVQDGASTDETVKILKKYSDRLRLVSEPDRGIGDAMDKALRRVTGDFIGIILADERYRPDAILWALEGFKHHPDAAVIYGDYACVNEKYEMSSICRLGQVNYDEIFTVEKVIPCPATFIRTGLLKEVGLHSDPAMVTCPDYEMWVRIGMKFPIKYFPGIVADNMAHLGSATCCVESYPLYIQLKRYVIEKTVNGLETPAEIKKLKNRALAGLYYWAASSVLLLGDLPRALKYYWLGFWTRPRVGPIKMSALGILTGLLRQWVQKLMKMQTKSV